MRLKRQRFRTTFEQNSLINKLIVRSRPHNPTGSRRFERLRFFLHTGTVVIACRQQICLRHSDGVDRRFISQLNLHRVISPTTRFVYSPPIFVCLSFLFLERSRNNGFPGGSSQNPTDVFNFTFLFLFSLSARKCSRIYIFIQIEKSITYVKRQMVN